ncbi:hypothetical protein GCM10010517_62030 [Streptosporangium fragile]|uniref:Uncharacterized protein n=1 Tax=Streptosporangium fragile TaxID=46186 RepID=A0ABN3W513_9ACTN
MWLFDRTVRQIRGNPVLLTYQPPEPGRLEEVLRLHDPRLRRSGDWLVAGGAKFRWAELTPEQAASAGLPAGRRGAIIVRHRNRTTGSFILNGVASRLGGAIYPPEEQDDYVDVEVRMRKSDGIGCDGAAQLIRPILGARTVEHDHGLGMCQIVGGEGDPVVVTYNWPGADAEHIVDLELDAEDPADLPALERLYRAAVAIAETTGASITCKDFPVTRLEDIVPPTDRFPG